MKYEDVKTPEELLEFMDSIEYGFETNDGKRYYGSEEVSNHINEWDLQNPSRLLTSKLGHCFDQVELERDWFSSHNYEFKTLFLIFYIEVENNYPTHTLLAYEKNGKWYHFEHADGLNRGIHEYETYESLLNSIKKRQIEYAQLENNELKNTLRVYEYETPHFGANFIEFINNIVD